MSGRAQLLLIMGFSTIFLVVGFNMSSVSTRVERNYEQYYARSAAKSIADAGVNIALARIDQDSSWEGSFSNDFSGGTYEVTASETELSPGVFRKTVTSIGSLGSESDSTVVVLQREAGMTLARWAYFIQRPIVNPDAAWNMRRTWYQTRWSSGDTVWGPMFSNLWLFDDTGPGVFWDNVACRNTYTPCKAQFNGGLETGGADADWSWSDTAGLRLAAQSGGLVIADDQDRFTDTRLWFDADGSVGITTRLDTGTYSSSWSIIGYDGDGNPYTVRQGPEAFPVDQTVALTTLAPNGLIYSRNGNIHLQGTLNGRVTVVANTSRQPSNPAAERSGHILIDNDIVYSRNPATDPGCTDALGAVSFFSSWVNKGTPDGQATSMTIDGIFFNIAGEMNSQYTWYNSNYGANPEPVLVLNGGSISNRTNPIYTSWYGHSPLLNFPMQGFGDGILSNGFTKNIRFDTRLLTSPPPFFPSINSGYRIISWFE